MVSACVTLKKPSVFSKNEAERSVAGSNLTAQTATVYVWEKFSKCVRYQKMSDDDWKYLDQLQGKKVKGRRITQRTLLQDLIDKNCAYILDKEVLAYHGRPDKIMKMLIISRVFRRIGTVNRFPFEFYAIHPKIFSRDDSVLWEPVDYRLPQSSNNVGHVILKHKKLFAFYKGRDCVLKCVKFKFRPSPAAHSGKKADFYANDGHPFHIKEVKIKESSLTGLLSDCPAS